MLLSTLRRGLRYAVGLVTSRYRSRSSVTTLLRQDIDVNTVKREKWTEADVHVLPAGEHDYFERKSGQLFANTGDLLGSLAKAISAMANSGGGHIILGVDDSGMPDGVPPMQARTPTRDWLEQKIPHLVEYPLSDFRVHVAEPSSPSRIPTGKQVIVIDVGDSALAPHQCAHGGGNARKYTYYYRQAGHSEPAPHFHLELLRQRLVNPALEAKFTGLVPVRAQRVDEGLFLATRLKFKTQNIGRVAAYKWQLQITEMRGHDNTRTDDYKFRIGDYPPGWSMTRGIRVDDTILPGCALDEEIDLGVLLRVSDPMTKAVRAEIERVIRPITLGYRLATETSPGKLQLMELGASADFVALADFVSEELN